MNEDKAGRYHRLKRRVSIGRWSAVLLVALVWSGRAGGYATARTR